MHLSVFTLTVLFSFSLPLALSAPTSPDNERAELQRRASDQVDITNSTSILTVQEQSTATSLIVYHADSTAAETTASESTAETLATSASASAATLNPTPTTTFSLLGALSTSSDTASASGSSYTSGQVIVADASSSSSSSSSSATSTTTSTSTATSGAKRSYASMTGTTALAIIAACIIGSVM